VSADSCHCHCYKAEGKIAGDLYLWGKTGIYGKVSLIR